MGNRISSFYSWFAGVFRDIPNRNILLLGLDNAGKTSLLYRLKNNEMQSQIPTVGFNVEQVSVDGVLLTAWDLGGQDKIRSLWHYYYDNCNGIVFVIDSCDAERFPDCADEIQLLLQQEQLKDLPILIFANKQDSEQSHTVPFIAESLDLVHIMKPQTPWHIQACSVLQNEGVYEGFKWFSDQLKKQQ